jgi:hypothetical protein
LKEVKAIPRKMIIGSKCPNTLLAKHPQGIVFPPIEAMKTEKSGKERNQKK